MSGSFAKGEGESCKGSGNWTCHSPFSLVERRYEPACLQITSLEVVPLCGVQIPSEHQDLCHQALLPPVIFPAFLPQLCYSGLLKRMPYYLWGLPHWLPAWLLGCKHDLQRPRFEGAWLFMLLLLSSMCSALHVSFSAGTWHRK